MKNNKPILNLKKEETKLFVNKLEETLGKKITLEHKQEIYACITSSKDSTTQEEHREIMKGMFTNIISKKMKVGEAFMHSSEKTLSKKLRNLNKMQLSLRERLKANS